MARMLLLVAALLTASGCAQVKETFKYVWKRNKNQNDPPQSPYLIDEEALQNRIDNRVMSHGKLF